MKSLVATLILASLALGAQAQTPATPRVDQRQANQEKRIDQGVKDRLGRPSALAMDDKDQLFVLDTSRGSVTVYSAAGEALQQRPDPRHQGRTRRRVTVADAVQQKRSGVGGTARFTHGRAEPAREDRHTVRSCRP